MDLVRGYFNTRLGGVLAVVLISMLIGPGCTDRGADPAAQARGSPSSGAVQSDGPRFRFVDVAAELGLERRITCGRPDKAHLLDSAGTGAAFLDYDRDGRLDIYLANGWKFLPSGTVERGRHVLYRATSDGRYEDVTEAAGVGGDGYWGAGICVADQNGDGWPDILVTHFGPNILYRNLSDGTFENVARRLGIEADGWNTGAAFFDADNDGDLDLYVARYIDCTESDVLAARPSLDWKGRELVAFGPFGLKGGPDVFFRAETTDRFVESTEEAELVDKALGYGLGVRAADFDNDGDTDLYVANDSDANYYFRNEGAGRFNEVALWAGNAFDAGGAAQASMGIAVGDVSGDGFFDLFLTHFAEDSSTYYRSVDGGFYEDDTKAAGLTTATYGPLSWGTAFADLDNDTDLDLVVVNGHIYPQVDRHPDIGMSYAQRNQLFENRGGRFFDVTDRAGPGFQLLQSSRGLAVGDIDNDGDLDLLITAIDAAPVLLRNDSHCGSWLRVACEVPPGEGTVIGTQIRVEVQGRTLLRDITSSDSYVSAHDPRAHFGLGAAGEAERVEVRWPDGTTTLRRNVKARQILVVRKGN